MNKNIAKEIYIYEPDERDSILEDFDLSELGIGFEIGDFVQSEDQEGIIIQVLPYTLILDGGITVDKEDVITHHPNR